MGQLSPGRVKGLFEIVGFKKKEILLQLDSSLSGTEGMTIIASQVDRRLHSPAWLIL